MHLDGLTLIAAGAFATLVSALLLAGAWTQIRTPALLWWAASAFTNALSKHCFYLRMYILYPIIDFETSFLNFVIDCDKFTFDFYIFF